ncbi:MAG: manganese catalase family protein [Clostridia bacterium]|nr:manganese catalase family protein [Clostridia bacterium]
MYLDKINNIHFEENYCIKDQYPEITLNHLQQEVLVMLKRIYAGRKSEFTSLTQYMYQHYIVWSNPKLNNLSEMLEKIATQEMKHHEIIAKILVKSGIDPKNCVYIDGNSNLCDYWKASSVSYEKTLTKMFKSNILLEQRAIEDYNEVLNKTDNANLKQIIIRILQDEYVHLEYFKNVLELLKN